MNKKLKTVTGFSVKKIKSSEASGVTNEKLSKMRTFSTKTSGIKKSLIDDLKANGFNSKVARSFAGVSIMCGVALGSMSSINSMDASSIRSNAMEASYKFNLVQLNQDENVSLVGGMDKREEIGKEFEAVMEVGKNVNSFEGKFGTVKYVLLETKNGTVAFVQKYPNANVDKQNIVDLEKHFKNDAAKFENIETITTYSAFAPKDLYESFSASYMKRGLDTSSVRKFFANNEIKVSKVNGESFLNLKLDSSNLTSKDRKILDVAKAYYGNKIYVNGLNIEGKKLPEGDNYLTVSVNI